MEFAWLLMMMRKRARQTVSVLCAFATLLLSLSGFSATPAGKQCPTASVQLISCPIKEKCGCVVGYALRAPHPGDKEFLQCRCSEKRSGDNQSAVSPIFDFIIYEPINVSQPAKLGNEWQSLPPVAHAYAVESAPLLQPPSLS